MPKTNRAISGPVGPENQSKKPDPNGGSGPVGPPDQPEDQKKSPK